MNIDRMPKGKFPHFFRRAPALVFLASALALSACGGGGGGGGNDGGGNPPPGPGPAPLALDPSFGANGTVVTHVSATDNNAKKSEMGSATAVAVQVDGKIVAGGNTFVTTEDPFNRLTYQDYDFALVRYNTDGSLDTLFGKLGNVVTNISITDDKLNTLRRDDQLNALAVQSDGKIVAAGFATVLGNPDFAVVRYNTDGSLDTTFDGDGIVTTPIGDGEDEVNAIAIDSMGRIVAAGYTTTAGIYSFALARYNPDGTLDGTFGSGGIVTTLVGTVYSIAYALALLPDNAIILAGETWVGSYSVALVQIDSNGNLDTAFGDGGIVTSAVDCGYYCGTSIGIQPDGKIVAASSVLNGSNYDFALLRYYPDGATDTDFGSNGIAATAIGNGHDLAYALGIRSDGSIVAAGSASNGNNNNMDFALARFLPTGGLDPSFGNSGVTSTPIGPYWAEAFALAIQPDDSVVLAGYTQNETDTDFAVARYLP